MINRNVIKHPAQRSYGEIYRILGLTKPHSLTWSLNSINSFDVRIIYLPFWYLTYMSRCENFAWQMSISPIINLGLWSWLQLIMRRLSLLTMVDKFSNPAVKSTISPANLITIELSVRAGILNIHISFINIAE